MTERDITFGRYISAGWEAVSANFGLTVGGTALYILIAMAASQIPGGSIVAMYPLVGGLYMIYLGIMKGLKPEINTLFAGFANTQVWARWLSVGWLLFLYELLVFLACVVPGGIVIGLGIAAIMCVHCIWAGVLLITLGSLILLALYYAIAVRWVFVFFAGAEGAGAYEAIEISQNLTEGLRSRIFWIMVAMGIINCAGMLLCYVGCFFTLAVTECGLAALYLDVKQLKAQQPPNVEQSQG